MVGLLLLFSGLCIGLGNAVSGLTAAGIVLPLVTGLNVNRELMVLAIGSGSLMCSHVNDSGFWLFKEYFSLSVKDTSSKHGTIMETSIGLTGLGGVMALSNVSVKSEFFRSIIRTVITFSKYEN